MKATVKFFIEIEQYDTDIYIFKETFLRYAIFFLNWGTSKNKFSYSTLYTSD